MGASSPPTRPGGAEFLEAPKGSEESFWLNLIGADARRKILIGQRPGGKLGRIKGVGGWGACPPSTPLAPSTPPPPQVPIPPQTLPTPPPPPSSPLQWC